MKSSVSKSLLMTALITGSVIAGSASAFAAEELQEFSLDQMVVTATRTEKRDVDVPASTLIITQKEIENTGAKSVAELLGKQSGIAYKTFGPLGSAMGTMINELNIRGISNGTLVMVNGNPISWRGKYNLESIATDNVERIEMVKTGGSVLYGSEAMGGVVNIITKKKGSNSISVGYGNRKHQNYRLSVGDDKFYASYNQEKMGRVNGISEGSVEYSKLKSGTRTDADDIKKQNIALGYNINDNLSVNYNYYEAKATYNRYLYDVATGKGVVEGEQFNGRDYTQKQHSAQINYKDENYKASLYINQSTTEAEGPSYFRTSSSPKTRQGNREFSNYHTKEKNRTWGTDVQRNWKLGEKAETILGFTFQKEFYDKSVFAADDNYDRNNLAVYGQWDQKFDDKNSMIIGARESWTTGAPGDQNYSDFSLAGSYVHKLDDDQSLYASYTESFIMPTFAQMYGASDTAIANPGLKPQRGKNYEIGWKKVSGDHNWKAALYRINIKDNITATWTKSKGSYSYNNEDFKNTGIEVTSEVKDNNGFSYNWGINYMNPQSKSDKKPYWDRKFGRVQLNGGVTYETGKWTNNLTASYLASRVGTPSGEHSEKIKPYLLTSLSSTYKMDEHSDLNLTIDNLFDRRDNLSHSGGAYYITPFSFLLSYTYKF